MAKELYIYGYFGSYSAEEFVREMEAAKSDDITIRLNTGGGDPRDTWSCLGKFSEHKKKKTVKVDGKALSAGLFFCCYADYVECLDVSEFLLHRAAYAQWFENDMNDADKQSLVATNKNLRAALEAKIDVKKFEKISGFTLDNVFDMNNRIDVNLTAQQALEIGLVQKINPITPGVAADINARVDNYMAKAANSSNADLHVKMAAQTSKPNPEPKKSNTMTLAELKANHPAVYAEIFNAGVTEERDRVSACLVYNEIDPKGVKAAIASGKPLTQTQMAEFALKQLSPEALKKMAEGNAPDITTDKPADEAETPAQKEAKRFAADLKAELGLGKK